jgi:hypothetical protein
MVRCPGGSPRSNRRTCCCCSVKMCKSSWLAGSYPDSSSEAALLSGRRVILRYLRIATLRTHAAGSLMEFRFLQARTIASCVASSASARLAPIVISSTTVLPNRSRKNEGKPSSVNYWKMRALLSPFARVLGCQMTPVRRLGHAPSHWSPNPDETESSHQTRYLAWRVWPPNGGQHLAAVANECLRDQSNVQRPNEIFFRF